MGANIPRPEAVFASIVIARIGAKRSNLRVPTDGDYFASFAMTGGMRAGEMLVRFEWPSAVAVRAIGLSIRHSSTGARQ